MVIILIMLVILAVVVTLLVFYIKDDNNNYKTSLIEITKEITRMKSSPCNVLLVENQTCIKWIDNSAQDKDGQTNMKDHQLTDTLDNHNMQEQAKEAPSSENTSPVKLWLDDYKSIVAPVIRVFNSKSSQNKKLIKDVDNVYIVGEPFIAFDRGYQMLMSLCPSGCHDGNGTHLSVYLHLMKGPYDDELEQASQWPLSGVFKIEVLNQFSDECHTGCYITLDKNVCSNCTNRVEEDEVAFGHGISQFRQLSGLNNTVYFQNDTLYFRISYSKYHFFFAVMELISEVPIIVKIFVYNWVFVSVLLIFLEFIAFCLEETVLRPRIVDEELGFGSIKRFLFTNRSARHVIGHTGYTVLCRSIRHICIIMVVDVLFMFLHATLEIVYADMSTVMGRVEVVALMLRRIGELMMWSWTIEIYTTSWGRNIPMIGPAWIIRLFQLDLFKILDIVYKIYSAQEYLFQFFLYFYTALFLLHVVRCIMHA